MSNLIFIEVDKLLFNSKHHIIIGILYRPPNTSLEVFNKTKMYSLLNKIQREKKYAYFLGDYNVNTKFVMKNSTMLTQQFSNMFLSNNFQKLITVPTRERELSSTLIDNIYTNDPQMGNSGVLKWDTSDHYLIFSIRQNTEPIQKVKFRKRRDFNIKNVSNFKKSLYAKEWFRMYDMTSVGLFFLISLIL